MKIKVTIPKNRLLLLGKDIVNSIHANTLAGKDKDGNPFDGYSTNPFAMPSGAITKRALSALDKAGGLVWFKKDKSEWVVILGGYAELKKVLRPKDGGTVNLSVTGEMLNDLDVISVKTDTLQLGFQREESAQKAEWNIARGRDFLGIPDSELERLARKHLGDGIKIEIVE